jgi:hypothetical protein
VRSVVRGDARPQDDAGTCGVLTLRWSSSDQVETMNKKGVNAMGRWPGDVVDVGWPRVAEAFAGPSPLHYPPPLPGDVSSSVIFP